MTTGAELRQAACEAALAAGKLIVEMAQKPLEVSLKGFRDTVTAADYAAQKLIIDTIHARYPDHGFVGEEDDDATAGEADYAGTVWIIDPVDGTSNYARGVPLSTVSVAVATGGVVMAGAIYDPWREELFSAELNGGAFLNEQPIRVSIVNDMARALVTFDWSRAQENRRRLLNMLENVAFNSKTVRSIGSAAIVMAWIAAGRVDAYFNLQLSAWDIAAAALIISEAGGHVAGLDGTPFDIQNPNTWATASNKILHPNLLALLN